MIIVPRARVIPSFLELWLWWKISVTFSLAVYDPCECLTSPSKPSALSFELLRLRACLWLPFLGLLFHSKPVFKNLKFRKATFSRSWRSFSFFWRSMSCFARISLRFSMRSLELEISKWIRGTLYFRLFNSTSSFFRCSKCLLIISCRSQRSLSAFFRVISEMSIP